MTRHGLSVEDRFALHVAQGCPGECWPWTASTDGKGYGKLTVEGRQVIASRLAYEITHGPIPPEAVIRHKCDNPPCCNPNHLEIGTISDNMADCLERGRHVFASQTHCKHGHSLMDPANVYRRPDRPGSRVCRTCHRKYQAKRRQGKGVPA